MSEKNIFYKGVINKKIGLSIVNIGDNLKNTIEKVISKEIEGKCVTEGYIKNNSVKVISYSGGLINEGNIFFDVVLECLICYPVEGMIINCIVKNITKAGIKAETEDSPSPVIIFLAKEHHKNIKSSDKALILKHETSMFLKLNKNLEKNPSTYNSILKQILYIFIDKT